MSAIRSSTSPFSHAVPTRVTELIRTQITLGSDSHFYAGFGSGGAASGLFIATHRAVRLGERLLVEVTLDGHLIASSGIVRWRTPGGGDVPPGIGVTLDDVSPRDRSAIERFCARRPPFYFDVAEPLCA
jgi:Tfp pilus assembly protein PilZ